MHKVLANTISKTQVITKMGLRKAVGRAAVGRAVLQDDGYTESYITIWACYQGMFRKRMVKVCTASQPSHLVVVAD